MDKNGSLKATVHRALEEGIIHGEYRPNEILNERILTEKFGCSKAPVREALIALCNNGVLRNLPRCGYEVVRITKDDIENMLEYRQLLEGEFLRKSILQITPKKIDVLKELHLSCQQESAMMVHWDRNAAFHLKLLSFADNGYAYKQLEQTVITLKYAYGQYYWDKWDDRCYAKKDCHHEGLIAAIEEKNVERALDYLKADLADFLY